MCVTASHDLNPFVTKERPRFPRPQSSLRELLKSAAIFWGAVPPFFPTRPAWSPRQSFWAAVSLSANLLPLCGQPLVAQSLVPFLVLRTDVYPSQIHTLKL